MPVKGKVVWVSGPAVKADGMAASKMYETVEVGDAKMVGEVIRLTGDVAFIQVYESTSGLRPGEPVYGTGLPLSVSLGPGMMGNIYDGLQRPLNIIAEKSGAFIGKGVTAPQIPFDKKWDFTPRVKVGDEVVGGTILGTVPETQLIEHRILTPPNTPKGKVVDVVPAGKYEIEQVIVTIDSDGKKIPLKMYHRWPVRIPRPSVERFEPEIPLLTGQRVIDTYFPIAKGGTGAIPGGFGTGKCVPAGTPVLMADGELVAIDDIYNKAPKSCEVPLGENEAAIPVRGLEVLSFDGRKFVKKAITHVYRGITSTLLRIRMRNGKTVTVTPAHKLFRFVDNGTFEEIAAANLSVGDYLAAPRKIPISATFREIDAYSIGGRVADEEILQNVSSVISDLTRKLGSRRALAKKLGLSEAVLTEYASGRNRPTAKFVKQLYVFAELEWPQLSHLSIERNGSRVRIPHKMDEEFAEFFGLLLSDGMIAGRQVRFFNNDHLLLERFAKLAKNLFEVDCSSIHMRTDDAVCFNSLIVISLLRSLGYPPSRKSQNVRVPKIIAQSPDSVVASFVRGYYLGDGTYSKRVVEFTSESEKFINDLSYLLSRLGILYSINRGAREGHRLTISSSKEVRNLYEAIFASDDYTKQILKVDRIRAYLADETQFKTGNSQTRDVIPLSAEVLRDIFAARLVKNYVSNGERLGAFKFAQLVQSVLSSSLVKLEGLIQALDYVVLDRIETIETIAGEQAVYDVTVEDTHNFIGGHLPSILHNTVTLHQVATWADAKVVFHVGCGERGNEMTEVLVKFPELKDPNTGRPLMERTILVANTSNMPVAAREASIYTGVTMAEYYRDMGYDTVLVADSTSRWAEALREISGRLEEMPAEEGYPSYLASRLAEFYERAGRVRAQGTPERNGSVTLIGAVSPTGADFTEPVTTHTIRFIRTFWALDTRLAYSRHYPAINWMTSYSGYVSTVAKWWAQNVSKDWESLRGESYEVLQREDTLREIVRLLGPEALPDEEKLILEIARMIKIGFLQQNSYDAVDTYCSPQKQFKMMSIMVTFYQEALNALRNGVSLAQVRASPLIPRILRAKFEIKETELNKLDDLMEDIKKEFRQMTTQEVAAIAK